MLLDYHCYPNPSLGCSFESCLMMTATPREANNICCGPAAFGGHRVPSDKSFRHLTKRHRSRTRAGPLLGPPLSTHLPPATHSCLIVDESGYFLFFIATAIKNKYRIEPQSEYNGRWVESSGPRRSHYACVRPKIKYIRHVVKVGFDKAFNMNSIETQLHWWWANAYWACRWLSLFAFLLPWIVMFSESRKIRLLWNTENPCQKGSTGSNTHRTTRRLAEMAPHCSPPNQNNLVKVLSYVCGDRPVQGGRDEESNDSSTIRGDSEPPNPWIYIPEGDEDLYGDGQDVSPPLAHAAPVHEASVGANHYQPSMPSIQGMLQGDTVWQQGLRRNLEDLVSKLSSCHIVRKTTVNSDE
ncbi:unnamed protein product [Fusarium graminearum]|uniref:Uncharacterized protein n=1 Tax=Gibberella zeae TaxID=5518 RepID=A0A9N8NF71_GIBZA|nr:unnamed protein product [Fusarium graminearum]